MIKEKNLLKQENIEFQRIQNIFQNEIEDMRLKNFNINTKFTIIGIQNNWYEQSSSEYKEYSLEQIKNIIFMGVNSKILFLKLKKRQELQKLMKSKITY